MSGLAPIIKNSALIIGLSVTGWQTSPASAMGYGIYDARAMAMGGAAIAVGNTSQAAYYNPALLAFHEGDEDQTNDGRVYLPNVTAQASTALDSAINAVDDKLDSKLSQALIAFNAQQTPETASRVATSARDLRKVLDRVANQDITFEAFAGISASHPGDHEGSAFYIGVRSFGVATSYVPDKDVDTLDDYTNAMDKLSSGVALPIILVLHSNLIEGGKFIDPTTKFTSTADISALVIGEWGIALAKEFSYREQPVLIGITPKLMRIDAYRDSANFNNNFTNNITLQQLSNTKTSMTTLNADIGLATVLADHYRLSVAVKDLFAKDFNTQQATGADLPVKLRSRSRMGAAYVSDRLSLGLDYDLQASTPMAKEMQDQQLSLGVEYKPYRYLALRAGYSHDKAKRTDNIFSGGVGYQAGRFVADIAYSQSPNMKGASLQVGWTF